jgi:hypothetical protein
MGQFQTFWYHWNFIYIYDFCDYFRLKSIKGVIVCGIASMQLTIRVA